MALSTTYITVPFLIGAQGVLHPAVPRRSASREAALVTADRLAPFYAGVIVLRDRSDPAAGIFLEPLLVCAIGDVPREVMADLAA